MEENANPHAPVTGHATTGRHTATNYDATPNRHGTGGCPSPREAPRDLFAPETRAAELKKEAVYLPSWT